MGFSGGIMNQQPIMIMRATQKKRMSKPVISSDVGYNTSRSRVASGQPRAVNGSSAEENQVSSTSVSCSRFAPPHFEQLAGASRATINPPHAQRHAGMRCPHHNCRDMHQSWMLYIQFR